MSEFKLDLEKLIEAHLFELPIGEYGPENGFTLHAYIYVIIDKILIKQKELDCQTKDKLMEYQKIYLHIDVDKTQDFPNHHEVIKFLSSLNI